MDNSGKLLWKMKIFTLLQYFETGNFFRIPKTRFYSETGTLFQIFRKLKNFQYLTFLQMLKILTDFKISELYRIRKIFKMKDLFKISPNLEKFSKN